MAVREFYGSPHYLALPYVQIGTELRALLLAKPHPLKPSDNMDVFNIAAVLPYADLMVIDGAMIENSTKRRLAERFGCQTRRLTTVGEFLDAAESGSWRRVDRSGVRQWHLTNAMDVRSDPWPAACSFSRQRPTRIFCSTTSTSQPPCGCSSGGVSPPSTSIVQQCPG